MTDKKTTIQEQDKNMLNLTLTGREGQPGMSMTHCSTFCGECYHRKVEDYSFLIPKLFLLIPKLFILIPKLFILIPKLFILIPNLFILIPKLIIMALFHVRTT